GILRIRIGKRQQKPPRIGTPRIITDTALDLREPLAFSTPAVHQPDLCALDLAAAGRIAAASRQKRYPFPIGTPPGPRFPIRTAGKLYILRTIRTHHPDIGIPTVLERVDGRNRIRDPLSIGRNLGIANYR